MFNKTDGIRKQASFEKHLALLEQETSFSHRENKALLEKINFLENENRKIRSENTSHLQTIAVIHKKRFELKDLFVSSIIHSIFWKLLLEPEAQSR